MSAKLLTQGPHARARLPFCWSAVACAAAATVLSGCGSFSGASSRLANAITPYRVEIVQGNFVSREQVSLLQPGMAKAQVRELLGTPLLASVFHADRWDYVFTLRRQGVESQARKLAVFFKNDLLDRTEGDEMPTEAEFVSQIDTHRNLGKVPLLEVPEEVLKEFSLKNPPAPATGAAAAVAAVPASFPPLEVPGTLTQAWDASTQKAVAAATARSPVAAPLAAAPVVVTPVPVVAAPAVVQLPPPADLPQRPVAAAPSPAAPVASLSQPSAAPAAVAGAAAVVAAAAPVAAPPVVARAAPAPAPAPVSAAVPAAVVAVAPVAAAPVTIAPPPPARPAVAAPAPVPPAVASSTAFSSLEPELGSFLTGWMNDWQSRNANAFFSRYAPGFTGSSTSRAEWEALRRPRIESRLSISIGVLDVRARMVSPTEARVVFRQAYESDAGSEIGTKAMFLSKRDGRWLIDREFFTPAQ